MAVIVNIGGYSLVASHISGWKILRPNDGEPKTLVYGPGYGTGSVSYLEIKGDHAAMLSDAVLGKVV